MLSDSQSDGAGSIGVWRTPPGGTAPYDSLQVLGDRYMREFISFLEIGQLSEMPSKKGDDLIETLARASAMLDKVERQELRDVVGKFALSMGSLLDIDPKSSGLEPKSSEVDGVATEKANTVSPEVDVKSPEVMAIISAVLGRRLHHFVAPDRSELVRRAMVAALISSFEVLVGSIARHALTINKAALEKTEHEFTLEELSKYDSIDEARGELINRRVEALLLGSVDEWSKWCKRVLGFELSALTSDWPTVREVFARRNIIVHNAGFVNRRYLDAAEASGIALPEGIRIGDALNTGEDYLNSAIQRILALGLCLVYSVWRKLHPKGAKSAADWVVDRQETLAYDEVWLTVGEIAHYLKGARARRRTEYLSQVLGWLARRELHGADSIRDEVSDWDTSGLDVVFEIYRNCLLGNMERAVRLIERNRGRPHLTKYELAVHPIFSEIRTYLAAQQTTNGASSAATDSGA